MDSVTYHNIEYFKTQKLGNCFYIWCNNIIICTKVERLDFTDNGGMDNEDDGISEMAKLTAFIRMNR